MKNIFKCILLGATLFSATSCEEDWLDREPQTIITDEQTWNDPQIITAVLANFYNRLPAHQSLTVGWQAFAEYDDALWSGFGVDEWRNNLPNYGYDRWRLWDYGLIRDINLAIENITASTSLTETQKSEFVAELRFLRAYNYFELVKRMGGVPLVTTQLIYDFSGDPTPLQIPRSKEEEVYDFISSEVEAIKDQLGNTGSNTRANKFTALALKSRAMLYAGSLAKYNNQLAAPITTPGGEVGIPAARAEGYFQESLEASKEIINSGAYSLYQGNPDLGENFYEAIAKKSANPEVIWAQDFAVGKTHFFTFDNIFFSAREDNLSPSAITPSLNLVESYEYLDGSEGTLQTRTADNSDYIYYENPEDIFANKDARLYGTVIYPGSSFRGIEAEIQAGVVVWNGSSYEVVEGPLGSTYTDGGLLTGADGPRRSQLETTNTGFYLRKYLDAQAGAGSRSQLSTMWWVRFRYAEVLLNAAEAALELELEDEAVGYVNQVRERAGFGANSLSSLTIERLRNERRVELAFEDHRVWDVKRWRIAHEIWDGSASNPDASVYALYPYRVIRPGTPQHNKYIFMKMVAPRFVSPHLFRLGNYYSSIDQVVINNNPKIVRNPFH
ncbi:RagB/SusD family nutrient uptake outer membrane protein [Pontibacter harenae]|uniref:RagB/SusD family nutrient uptake outer membrane protein n=1 Tax=Pontibacter harenae TaxID=2894083 RepID=UPI001E2A52BF|nr:RagB/SusD family nutrient uptake outer membrane protein [Pontibacter harenae]MCC9165790.1 RagB/SusD family nutrient uptake outer membrane protein [Pontibacter harenae]